MSLIPGANFLVCDGCTHETQLQPTKSAGIAKTLKQGNGRKNAPPWAPYDAEGTREVLVLILKASIFNFPPRSRTRGEAIVIYLLSPRWTEKKTGT